MAYEIFTREVIRTGSPRISVNTLGRVGINQAATKILKDNAVEFVLLLWDKERNKIAIRPITKKDKRAYIVTFAPKGNGAGFSAKTFFKYIGYDYAETRSLAAEWNENEGILEIDVPPENLKDRKQDTGISPKDHISAVRHRLK